MSKTTLGHLYPSIFRVSFVTANVEFQLASGAVPILGKSNHLLRMWCGSQRDLEGRWSPARDVEAQTLAQAKYVHPESFSIGELKLDTSPSWQSSPHGLCLKVVPGCFVNWGHCSKLLSGVRSRLGLSPGWCSFVGRWSLQLMYLLWNITWRSGLSNQQCILRETNWPTTF